MNERESVLHGRFFYEEWRTTAGFSRKRPFPPIENNGFCRFDRQFSL
ncbi:hypothetical protein BRO54_2535 [Geobacillus proteiniphilus]|uniref:Uncharacterized protein n=1 Tax=Geobacillus proteiniphilus TaxID=860353 RepID=A0A1Q5SVN5_9BACL|nr:hypothetical protein BRO54_2535 [Geobacillus proteiniphilus]